MQFNHRSTNVTRCGLALLLTASLAARGETTNLTAVADTSLHLFFPDFNFGGGTSITSGGRNMGGHARALLRFDIAAHLPPGANINSAQLTLTAIVNVNGPGSTFDLHRVLAGWGEGRGDDRTGSAALAGEATWNHRLATSTAWSSAGGEFQAAASGSQQVAGLGSYVFSGTGMAADVQSWLDDPGANFGWLLRSQTETTLGTIRRFAGRTALADVPQLVIDYTTSAPPPAVPPVLSSPVRVGNEIQFSFNAQSNRTYAVEFRDTLGVTNWSVLTNIPALPADVTIHITNGVTGNERYFRARTP
jgi:hypothetical protein